MNLDRSGNLILQSELHVGAICRYNLGGIYTSKLHPM